MPCDVVSDLGQSCDLSLPHDPPRLHHSPGAGWWQHIPKEDRYTLDMAIRDYAPLPVTRG